MLSRGFQAEGQLLKIDYKGSKMRDGSATEDQVPKVYEFALNPDLASILHTLSDGQTPI
jgi:hypothetical protein